MVFTAEDVTQEGVLWNEYNGNFHTPGVLISASKWDELGTELFTKESQGSSDFTGETMLQEAALWNEATQIWNTLFGFWNILGTELFTEETKSSSNFITTLPWNILYPNLSSPVLWNDANIDFNSYIFWNLLGTELFIAET